MTRSVRQFRTLSFIILILLGLGFAQAAETQTFEASPGGTLSLVCKSGGSAHITGWDQDQIEVNYQDKSNDLSDWDIEFEETSDGLVITSKIASDINSSSMHFEIMVPRNYDLRFESAGGGLTLENLEGSFTGKTAGGEFNLTRVDGKARLRSGGGQIRVEDCELNGNISTGGGKVWVTDVVGDLKVTSGGGNIRYNNVRDRQGHLRSPNGEKVGGMSEDSVLISSAGGGIDLDEAPQGAIVRTGGGNINIKNAEKFVIAKTGGGDIDVAIHNGWTRVTTGAGDIGVIFSGDHFNIEGKTVIRSGYGDVTIMVPENFQLDIDIDLKMTHNSERNYRIISDLPLDQEPPQDLGKNGHNRMKHIVATSPSGSGHPVKIQTTNGNISIKVIQE